MKSIMKKTFLISSLCLCIVAGEAGMANVRQRDVTACSKDFGALLRNYSCEVLRSGGQLCGIPGLSDVYDTLLTGVQLYCLEPQAILFMRVLYLIKASLNFEAAKSVRK